MAVDSDRASAHNFEALAAMPGSLSNLSNLGSVIPHGADSAARTGVVEARRDAEFTVPMGDEERSPLTPPDCWSRPRTGKRAASWTTRTASGLGLPMKTSECPDGCSSPATSGQSAPRRPIQQPAPGRRRLLLRPAAALAGDPLVAGRASGRVPRPSLFFPSHSITVAAGGIETAGPAQTQQSSRDFCLSIVAGGSGRHWRSVFSFRSRRVASRVCRFRNACRSGDRRAQGLRSPWLGCLDRLRPSA